jgi:enoyl-CoA hydratase/carnithine racemase
VSFRYDGPDADGVATLTLDRPERLNAITFAVYRELTDLFLALDAEPGVRAAVITGSGRGFCAGGAVAEIISRLRGRDAQARS